jgi:hypothetical protein
MQATTRLRSIYTCECLCGRQINSETLETQCTFCQRWIRLTWPVENSSKAVEATEEKEDAT